MTLQKFVLLLALWFLLDWSYNQKLKPFLQDQFATQESAKDTTIKKEPVLKDQFKNEKPAKDTVIKKEPGFDKSESLVKKLLEKDSVTFGLDISHYQGDLISALNKRKDSLYFVICKATEGTSYIDPTYETNCKILKEKHVVRGAYHFYLCEYDPIAQAQHFAKVITENQFLKIGQLPPVLDIENASMDSNCGNLSTSQKNILLFLEEVEKLTGRIPMIYTNKSTGDKFLNSPDFAKYPLWIAAYSSDLTEKNIPTAWKNNWTFWQRSDSYSYQETNFDFDIFDGNRLELRKFIRNTIVKNKPTK